MDNNIGSIDITTTDSTITNTSDLLGKWLVLYFYPKDNTPGCSIQAKDFTAAKDKFDALQTCIIGVSRDSIALHDKFTDKLNINYPLISDQNEELCSFFEVIKEKSMFGKKYMGIERSTFIIDPTGEIKHAWRKIKIKNHIEDVLKEIKKIQGL